MASSPGTRIRSSIPPLRIRCKIRRRPHMALPCDFQRVERVTDFTEIHRAPPHRANSRAPLRISPRRGRGSRLGEAPALGQIVRLDMPERLLLLRCPVNGIRPWRQKILWQGHSTGNYPIFRRQRCLAIPVISSTQPESVEHACNSLYFLCVYGIVF